MIWREKRILLIILGILLAANTVFFFTYRVQYQQRISALEERQAESEAKLKQARAARISAERQLAGYRQIEHDVAQVYDEQWSTQQARLTRMIAEVQRLAVAANLVPRSYNFDKQDPKAETAVSGTGRKLNIDATEVGISFSVEGTYEQARRLINLLELSNQFVIIDAVSLTSTAGPTLNLNLHVKTIFRNPEPAPTADRQL